MTDLIKAHLDHRRVWRDFDYCYPVISRRSRGVSLGVNLNPDKVCNFDCVYCEVDRLAPPKRKDLDLDQLDRELATLLDLTISGEIYEIPPFNSARPEHRRLNDIAFSGDGEPTTAREFPEVVARVARLKVQRSLELVKLVLITDSSRLQAPEVVRGLDTLMAHEGEIWAKLDAGTEDYYREICRSKVPFERILDNLLATSRRWPMVIQTLFLEWKGRGPDNAEFEAYCQRLEHLQREGGQLQAVQLYTVARPTPEPEARPLRRLEMDAIAANLRSRIPSLPVEVYYGPEEWA
ncbi:radical SAM protein [Geothrix sp. PMB-07]|uniref:radical SAM protein n=1 Tax=Geothrix sp. PMB-07 TaxID=3068640 RepID=UPI00274041BE|nr:radical SAM protein [Geothrix sp. PMB-07]WLT33526.1 radical SAM protein [Geothrix sp. PMB-07]